jgi:hypothetical protein
MIFNHISTSLLLFTSLFIGGQSSTSNTKSMDAQETDGKCWLCCWLVLMWLSTYRLLHQMNATR